MQKISNICLDSCNFGVWYHDWNTIILSWKSCKLQTIDFKLHDKLCWSCHWEHILSAIANSKLPKGHSSANTYYCCAQQYTTYSPVVEILFYVTRTKKLQWFARLLKERGYLYNPPLSQHSENFFLHIKKGMKYLHLPAAAMVDRGRRLMAIPRLFSKMYFLNPSSSMANCSLFSSCHDFILHHILDNLLMKILKIFNVLSE